MITLHVELTDAEAKQVRRALHRQCNQAGPRRVLAAMPLPKGQPKIARAEKKSRGCFVDLFCPSVQGEGPAVLTYNINRFSGILEFQEMMENYRMMHQSGHQFS